MEIQESKRTLAMTALKSMQALETQTERVEQQEWMQATLDSSTDLFPDHDFQITVFL